jgi:hypothetical protein
MSYFFYIFCGYMICKDSWEKFMIAALSVILRLSWGDANAQVGKEYEFLPVIGKKGLHQQTNNNGESL